MKKIIVLCLIGLFAVNTYAQGTIEVGGMEISWNYSEDRIYFSLTAPNDGWVALGFNHKDDIQDTHLLMFSTDGVNQRFEELYVKAAGNPVPVEELFGKTTEIQYRCSESGGTTYVDFSLDPNNYGELSTALQKGTELWLICAYSEEDEFDHHSMMRKHIKVVL